MKVLLTGGAGFIGSHITRLLLERGDQVVVLDNFSTTSKEEYFKNDFLHYDQFKLIEGSLSEQETLKNALQEVEVVIHMAALISVEESVKMPRKYAENNILGSIDLLQMMNEVGVKKIIFSSSATVYGSPNSLPLNEDAPLSSANPYAATKVAMEAFLESYHQTQGFDVLILRYFNPYGPGEMHKFETHAIPNFIESGLLHKPIPLYWKGQQIRDFIFVEDLAKAHLAILNLAGFQVFNVGTNTGTKIIDIVNKLSDIFGYSLEIEDRGERPGDVMENYASSLKLEQATGWKAQVSLENGLKQTVDYFKSRK